MATQTYTLKTTVQAQQFLKDVLPWPTGVTEDASSPSGYSFAPTSGPYFGSISNGDYVVECTLGQKVVLRSEFEDRYQLS